MIRNESLDWEPGNPFLNLRNESLRQEFAIFEQKCDQIGWFFVEKLQFDVESPKMTTRGPENKILEIQKKIQLQAKS